MWQFFAGCFVGGFTVLLAVALCVVSRQADNDDAEEIMKREQDELIERSLKYEDDRV